MEENTQEKELIDSPDLQEVKDRISGNILVGSLTNFLTICVRFLVPPYILLYLSLEEFGVWVACFILVGYVGILGSAPFDVVVQGTARLAHQRTPSRINQLVTTSVAAMTLIALVCCPLLYWGLPWILQILQVPSEKLSTAGTVILLTCYVHLLSMILYPFAGVLEGLQLIKLRKIIDFVALIAETAGIVLFLFLGWGLIGLLAALTLRTVASSIAIIIASYRALPSLSIRPGYLSMEAVHNLLSFGGILQINSLVAIVNRTMEKFLAGLFYGASGAAIMDLGTKMPTVSNTLAIPVNTVLLPAITHLKEAGDQERAHKLFIRASRYLGLLSGFLMAFLGIFSIPIVQCWLGQPDKLVMVPTLMLLFTLPYQLHLLTGPCSAYWRSTQRPYAELAYSIGQLLLYPTLLTIAYRAQTLTLLDIGVVVTTAMVVSALIYLVYTCRRLAIPVSRYFTQILIPSLVPYLIAYLIYWSTSAWLLAPDLDRLQLAVRILSVGVIYCVVCPATIYRLLFKWDERAYVRAQLIRSSTRLFDK